MKTVLVLVAHGTVEKLDDLPAFVQEIRRGRPAPPELLADLRMRYEKVGGSPLLTITRNLAGRLEEETRLETRVAMRLWEPRLQTVIADLSADDLVCLIPLAPFSVPVYHDAASAALADAALTERGSEGPRLVCVPPYGQTETLIEAWFESIRNELTHAGWIAPEPGPRPHVVLTAHSLPQSVIDNGDPYEREFRAAAHRVSERLAPLGIESSVAFQSQGASAGAWLGPRLDSTLEGLARAGKKRVCVAPIGFLSDHIETLYDLDIEARAQAERWGLEMTRAKALNDARGLVETLARLAIEALTQVPAR